MKKDCDKIRLSRGEARILAKKFNLQYYKCDKCEWWHTFDSIDKANVTIEVKE